MIRTYGCQKKVEKVGILLAQLGTPAAPTKKALKPYLKQFLSDPRVIEKNRIFWWFILNLFILPRRPAKSAELYKRVWTSEGSPLLKITAEQARGVQSILGKEFPEIEVDFGMRYGQPSIEQAIDRLVDEKHCTRILLFPMYPQYSATTTASTYDSFFSHILKRRFVPTVRVAEPYYRDRRYISALAKSVDDSLSTIDWKPDNLFLSYHGIPVEYRDKGDPYCCNCNETTEVLKKEINFPAKSVVHVFQSRFGRDPWLTPYTDETVVEYTKKGMKNLAIACPAFTADCLETIDEMGVEVRSEFEENGGENFLLIPCLNSNNYWINALSEIIKDELGSWLQRDKHNVSSLVTCPVACNS